MTDKNKVNPEDGALIVAKKEPQEIDISHGIQPKDFAELNRFADLVKRSGLAPKSFDTSEKIAIGILTNMELGRPIITGLQDLAIINGRAGIFGDAALAMVTASDLMEPGYPIEEEKGEPFTPEWTFIFKVKRKGGQERIGKWSWAESIRAGFDDPKTKDGRPDKWSPWSRFPRRMMQWKSRNFVLRDTFGDVLKGMKTVEDLHDLDAVPLTRQHDGSYATSPLTEDLSSSLKGAATTSTGPDTKGPPGPTTTTRVEAPGPGHDKTPPEDAPASQDKKILALTPNHPWFRANWANKRKGDGKKTGYAGHVNEHLSTFSEAPAEVQKDAREKWTGFYPKEIWPGDSIVDDDIKEDKGPSQEENPFHDGDPGAGAPIVGKAALGNLDEAKTKWPSKEEMEAEAAAAAKDKVVNLNAIRKFHKDIRQKAFDLLELKAPVLLSTESDVTVAKVLDYCQKIEAGEDPTASADTGQKSTGNGDKDMLIEEILEFDLEVRENAFKPLGVPMAANLAAYDVERLTDIFNHCVKEAKALMM